jgi:translation initiation factor IF-3
VIDDQGLNLGKLSVPEAVSLANARGLDLVEVGPTEKPPVCRFMDYGKFKYRKNKKAHEAKRNQKIIRIKEVKITPRTSEHDYQFKLAHTKRFISEGNKSKITVFFKGRQIDHKELGMVMLNRFIEDTKEYAVVGHPPTLEGRALSMILEPKGKGKHAAAPVPETEVQAAIEKIIKGDENAENQN